MNRSKPFILIVDDIQSNHEVIANVLFNNGIDIAFAFDGIQALKKIGIKKPDLILLDVAMPNMNGYQVCEKLKADPEFKNIPIIFLTAKAQTEDIVKGFELGAVDYITKPFNTNELFARVNTHLELNRAKDTIEHKNRLLEEINASKDKFFNIVAHDLKNPFNNISNFAQLMLRNLDRYDTEKLRNYIQVIHTSANESFKLLQNLLEWSRAQTGTLSFVPTSILASQLVNDTTSLLGVMVSQKKINLQIDCPSELQVWADAQMVATVMRNLVSNAVKFTPEKGTVTISVKEVSIKNLPMAAKYPIAINSESWNFVQFTIEDTGVGIAEEDKPKIFKIDHNHTTLGTSKERGTGLGLILSKEFVERNAGVIWFESTLGVGSKFIFVLPKSIIDGCH